jgi:hypothetical protein
MLIGVVVPKSTNKQHFSFDSSLFLSHTQTTRLINRTRIDSTTECSIRVGRPEFTRKFYRMITCRYVTDLAHIYPYLLTYSHDISALEITDSIINHWNSVAYERVFRRIEYLIFHRTILKRIDICPLNIFSTKLFYLHLTEFSPSLEQLIVNRTCSIMKRVHVLIIDRTPIGNETLLLPIFPHLHLLRLNFSSLNRPLTYSYMSSFVYLQDFFFKVNDDCHRCEYEWLKYASRDYSSILFRLSPQSGCMDWHDQGRFIRWQQAPLCGSCSLPLITNGRTTNELCRIEDGITDYYCNAFYGRESRFLTWTTRYQEQSVLTVIPLPSTIRPNQEFMKPKYTVTMMTKWKRHEHQTVGSMKYSL